MIIVYHSNGPVLRVPHPLDLPSGASHCSLLDSPPRSPFGISPALGLISKPCIRRQTNRRASQTKLTKFTSIPLHHRPPVGPSDDQSSAGMNKEVLQEYCLPCCRLLHQDSQYSGRPSSHRSVLALERRGFAGRASSASILEDILGSPSRLQRHQILLLVVTSPITKPPQRPVCYPPCWLK